MQYNIPEDYQRVWYVDKDNQVQSYIYDPDWNDINHFPCYLTEQEAIDATEKIKLKKTIKLNVNMKRKIKFRAWYKAKNQMFIVNDINGMLQHTNYQNKLGDIDIEADEAELMPFTGYVDKNGTEIYEGDYVCSSCEDQDDGYCDAFEINKVIFEDGSFNVENYFDSNADEEHSNYAFYSLYSQENIGDDGSILDCEVVGNIYESDIIALRSNLDKIKAELEKKEQIAEIEKDIKYLKNKLQDLN
jgi:uncharacterized phage protein (TIGR01671 family)